MSFWITVLTFAAVSLLVGGIAMLVYDIFFRYKSELTRRLSETFDDGLDNSKASPLFRDLRKMASHTAARAKWGDQLQLHLQQSGVPVTGWQLLAASMILPIVAVVLGLLNVLSVWFLLPLGVVGALAPWFFVSWKRRMRLQKMCSQLPRAFDMMSRAVRAGQTVPAAMQIVADDLDPPIAEEFGYCYEQQNLGIPAEITFRDLARRCGVMELQIFVVALLVQNRTGGNLTEMLDNLSSIVRKRMTLKNRVKALTGEGRMQAAVLTVLPIVALIALIILAPEYANTLLERPWLLGTAGGAQLLGIVWIRSIINFDT